jgi:O-acetyl-ADP-ribose deacetylase
MAAVFWSVLRVMTIRGAELLVLESGNVPVFYRDGRSEQLATAPLTRDLLGDLEPALTASGPVHVRDRQGDLFEVTARATAEQVRVTVRALGNDASGVTDVIDEAAAANETAAANEHVSSVCIGATKLELVTGDIADQETDAVVTAAHWDLAGGQGTDGAIHFRAGPGLLEECRRIGWCAIGSAVITGGHRLKARYVIHAVGPVWDRGNSNEAELLAAAYQHALRLAAEHRVRSISFPSLSTGAFCYPMRLAAPVAVNAIIDFLDGSPHALELVRIVLYTRESRDARTIFRDALTTAAQLRAT